MITFNNIVERFEDFATSHFFIKSFSFGSPDDVDLAKFTEFPLMHLVYTGATYDSGTKTYNIEVYILDVPADKSDKVERQREVVSDAEQCAEDIIADIRMGGNIFTFAQDYEVVNATTTPLEEETKNVLSGVLLDLSVAIPYEWDACNAPIDGVTPGGGDEPSYARRGFLRMLTLDGSTDVLSVRTIKVNNGTLTDDGEGVVTLDTGGVDTLSALTDVTLANLENHDVLKYNSGQTRWENVDWLLVLYAELKQGSSTIQNNGGATDSKLELTVTQAKLKAGITGVEITETSPGDIDLIVATDASGSTAYTAINIDGSTTANEADINLYGKVYIHDEGNGTKARLRLNSAGNVNLSLPTSSGTLALTGDIPSIPVDSVNGQTGVVVLVTTDIDEGTNLYYTDARVAANSAVVANTAKVGVIAGGTSGQALVKASGTDYDTEWANVSDTNTNLANTDLTQSGNRTFDHDGSNLEFDLNDGGEFAIKDSAQGSTIDNFLAGTNRVEIFGLEYPTTDGTSGQAITTDGNGILTFADVAAGTQYHDRFATDAETFRSGATDTVELYYTAKADGDGLAESASSDTPTAGKIIKRKIYYSEAAFADPDTGTWVEFTPAPADDASFATVKAALLEYLKARTGGTVPISLKQTWEEVTAAPAFTGLLNETYGSGAEAAYSTRRLNGNVTDCMVIRRASDSTTTTIGFDGSGNISEADIISFCTGTTCTVEEWLDQSGNGNDATQSTPADQPTIYTGGELVRDNGKLALDFDGSSDNFASTISNIAQSFDIYTVHSFDTTPTATERLYDSDNGGRITRGSNNTSDNFVFAGTVLSWSPQQTGQVQETTIYNGVNSIVRVSGTQTASGDAGTGSTGTDLVIGADKTATSQHIDGQIQEFIVFDNSKNTSDRTSIEENIGDYFTQNTPLLDTYSGAAAAYSLRLLDSTYTGSAIRVRRASNNDEQDIGFNVFGELDTVALAAFCGSSDGFIRTWYDQSGNSNDAEQDPTSGGSASAQPKIYDGTNGVVTENGKPALYFESSFISAPDIALSRATCFVHHTNFDANARMAAAFDRNENSFFYDTVTGYWMRNGDSIQITGLASTTKKLVYALVDSNGGELAINGATATTGTLYVLSGRMRLDIGKRINSYWKGTFSEVIVYDSDQSDNRTEIETNINTFYDIF